MASRTKNLLKTALKFIVSGVALYVVFRNIDWQQTKTTFLSAHIGWLLVATLFFILSKVLSSFRLNLYFGNTGLQLTEKYNLRLYWIGMFYNLFLPGGIGGDGYKVYLLNKLYGTKVKSLIQASLLDRISGLVSLLILAGIGYIFLDQSQLPGWILALDWVGLLISLPAFYYVVKIFFRDFISSFAASSAYSFGVQSLQVISAYFILVSLGVDAQFMEYQVLFLISSVVAVFPFTIGGVGARELTFILGYTYLGIDENVSIAFSLLFFLITAAVSLIGGFLREKA